MKHTPTTVTTGEASEAEARPVWQAPAVVDLTTTSTARGNGGSCSNGSADLVACISGAGNPN